MRFGFLAFAATLAVTVPAFAQTAAEQPAPAAQPQNAAQRFEAYATSEGYKKAIGQMAVMGASVSNPACKDQKAMNRAELIFYAYPQFDQGLHPVSGIWQDRIRMDSCGKTAYQNILMEAQPSAQPKIALMMPGLSAATPPTQNLVLKDVIGGLAAKKCTDVSQIIPFDTVVSKETKPRKVNPKGVLIEGAWQEVWTFQACGKTVKATVDFTANGKGGMTHKVKL
ncbi:hypothetical protein [Magnetospirillum sulfuroxidans]|uniref:Uncharacterized protein n=1 Tax=Magnetospirillum sulfuroxidans TaxID=611300 RepID=A0ABS5IES7_9PROT|nr:hypothetical protein [Magnetospirillum sulfuroxidans]MBR9972921.1 hypothetical protein [Magnetospirillum sulfuroxidans]